MFWHFLRHLYMWDYTKFQPNDTLTAPTDPFTNLSCRKCPHSGIVLQIANHTADFESGSPVSYSSFIVTVARLVSEIFDCNRLTDNADHYQPRPIAGHHIVAGQPTMHHCRRYGKQQGFQASRCRPMFSNANILWLLFCGGHTQPPPFDYGLE